MTDTTPLAVVTGASSGIGLELAKLLAADGHHVIACAEDAELTAAVTQIGHGAEAVQADLATDEGIHRLVDAIAFRPVAVLCLNAGIGAVGAFAGPERQADPEQELKMVDLNCRGTVHLAQHVIPGMLEHGGGRVLITSSVASTMPGAYQAVYNATKSFTQSFAEGIRQELLDHGVTVTSLMPGPTDTEFFDRADAGDAKLGADVSKDDPAKVARQGYDALMAGKEKVVAGSLMNKVQASTGRFLPDAVKSKLHGAMAKPGSAKDA